MNQNLKYFLLWVTMAWSISSNAQTQIINLSTGWNNGMVVAGTTEDTWTVYKPGMIQVTPKACTYSPTWEETGINRWISPYVTNGVATDIGGIGGTYTYRADFTLAAGHIDCARLDIKGIGGDNRITGMRINGINYPLTLPNTDHFQLTNENVMLVINPADLHSGINTLLIDVLNNTMPDTGAPTFNGLNFCGEIHVNGGSSNMQPVITGPTTLCEGSPLTFGGSLAAGSSPSTHYLWKILECDAVGTPVVNGFSWEFWYVGVPTGTYTFPSNMNPYPSCGKYYMVVLAAVRNTDCSNWVQDTHIFSYVCKPITNAGADKTICQGECVSIGSSLGSKNTSYSWTANGSVVGSGLSITVCPETTTTYTITGTNSITGCINTDQVTVTVLPNEPRFNIATNTANNNYYSVTATPIVMNANLVSGFGHFWSVEELVNNVSQFTIQNPTGWLPYPASCSFPGFDDYLTNYSNIVTTLPGSPAAGRFLYNHTYRITRATWNDNCDWNAYAYILTTVKSASGDEYQVVVEETKAPEFRPTMQQSTLNEWQINPNPSTGIFHISSASEGTDITVVEVFDLFGKKIDSKVIEAGMRLISLDLGGNAKGIYIVNITTSGMTNTHKIILE